MIGTVVCYFNPCHYENHRRNLKEFLANYRGPDLHLIELSFDGQFETDAQIKIKGNQRNLLWQKERLLNIAIESLPTKYDKVAWLDGDVIITNPLWHETAEYMLENGFKVLQPFSWVSCLDHKFEIERRYCNVSYAFNSPNFAIPKMMFPAPGFAWVARRDALPKKGLMEFHITGNADIMMVNSWMGNFSPEAYPINKAWHLYFLQESVQYYKLVRGKIGYVPGELIHMFHGTWNDRKYNQRAQYLAAYNYDPETDIALDEENGLLKWTGNKPELEKVVANYFYERKEDR